jgi:hypothetical protein
MSWRLSNSMINLFQGRYDGVPILPGLRRPDVLLCRRKKVPGQTHFLALVTFQCIFSSKIPSIDTNITPHRLFLNQGTLTEGESSVQLTS